MIGETLGAQGASVEEAAAVIAAIAHFAGDCEPAQRGTAAGPQQWLRAARLEAVGEDGERSPWGEPHPWGRSPHQ